MPRAYMPAPGFAQNPLLNLPRNMACPCESGKKFKACCLYLLPRFVPIPQALEYKEAMKRGFDQVRFGTPPEPAHLEIPPHE